MNKRYKNYKKSENKTITLKYIISSLNIVVNLLNAEKIYISGCLKETMMFFP